MSKILSFEEFVSADAIEYATVPVKGGDMRIGSITPNDLDGGNTLRETHEGRKVSGAVLIAKSAVDAKNA